MQVSKSFELTEFICPEVYAKFGSSSIWFLDHRIVDVVQYIRDQLNKKVVINDWHTGGEHKESGLRSFDTPTGGKMSQHKFGRAADIKVEGMYPFQVLQFIKDHWAQLHALGLTTIEDITKTPTWNHLDTRWTGRNDLFIVEP